MDTYIILELFSIVYFISLFMCILFAKLYRKSHYFWAGFVPCLNIVLVAMIIGDIFTNLVLKLPIVKSINGYFENDNK